MSIPQKMDSNKKDDSGPAIAPPLVILVCIAAAVAVVIAVAAMSLICRRGRSGADEDVEGGTWNPNKRNREQDRYMEEVRWRNNATVWERAKDEWRNRDEYQRGWFKDQLVRQRASEQGGWTAGSLNGTDENGGMHSYDASFLSQENVGICTDRSVTGSGNTS